MGEGGHTQDLTPGEVQHMSAGTGIMHSEFNPSPTEPVHLYQIWIEPKSDNIKPVYHQTRPEPAQNGLRLVASEGGVEGSFPINADAKLYLGQLDAGKSASYTLGKSRHAWVQVLRGGMTANGTSLVAGDGAAISDESALTLKGDSDAEFLVFDLA
jgi:redox-sensitive bicupin YhaK (pirin superfamily)